MSDDLVQQLRGRALYLRNMSRVKSPGLMERAADELDRLRAENAQLRGLAQQQDTWLGQRACQREKCVEYADLRGLVGEMRPHVQQERNRLMFTDAGRTIKALLTRADAAIGGAVTREDG